MNPTNKQPWTYTAHLIQEDQKTENKTLTTKEHFQEMIDFIIWLLYKPTK